MSFLVQLVSDGLVQGSVLMCVAAGFGMVYRSLGVFHIAVGAQLVFSSYSFYLAAAVLRLSPWVAVPLTLVLSVAFACALELSVYRPFAHKGCSGGVTMIASLGVLIVTENVIALCFGNEVKTVPHPPVSTLTAVGIRLTTLQGLQLVLSAGLFAIVGFLVGRSRWMKAAWALGDDAALVRSMNLPYGRIRIAVAAVSAVLVAVPAVLVAADTGMDPHDGMRWLLMASVAVFFGGRDAYWAWGAGALLLGVLQSVAVWKLPAEWSETLAFVLLLIVLMVFPQGLLGPARRPEERA